MNTKICLYLMLGISMLSSLSIAQPIDVEVNQPGDPGVKIKQLNAQSSSAIHLFNDEEKVFDIGIVGSQNNFFGQGNAAYLFTRSGAQTPIVFATEGKEQMRLSPNGSLMIGTPAPTALPTQAAIWISSRDSAAGIHIEHHQPEVNESALSILCRSKAPAIHATAIGGGSGLQVSSDSSNAIAGIGGSQHPTVWALNQDVGGAGHFEITNPHSNASALSCVTAGSGHALNVTGTAFKSDGNPNWTIASDERIKKDIRPFTDGLSVITQMRPISFKYNGMAGTSVNQEAVGIIAQEMREIAPYMIQKKALPRSIEGAEENALSEVLTYNPSALTYVMVNALKELNKLVEDQQQVINEQARSILSLKQILSTFDDGHLNPNVDTENKN